MSSLIWIQTVWLYIMRIATYMIVTKMVYRDLIFSRAPQVNYFVGEDV